MLEPGPASPAEGGGPQLAYVGVDGSLHLFEVVAARDRVLVQNCGHGSAKRDLEPVLAWSRTGDRIACKNTAGEVFAMDLASGEVRLLFAAGECPSAPRWVDDSLVCQAGNVLVLHSWEIARPEVRVAAESPLAEWSPSPYGAVGAFRAMRSTGLFRADGSLIATLDRAVPLQDLSWSPWGDLAALSEGVVVRVITLATGAMVDWPAPASVRILGWSVPGRELVVRSDHGGQAWRLDVQTGSLADLTIPSGYYTAALSPSGSQLALEDESRTPRVLAVLDLSSRSLVVAVGSSLPRLGYAEGAPRFDSSGRRACWQDTRTGAGCFDPGQSGARELPQLPPGAAPEVVRLSGLAPSLRWFACEIASDGGVELWVGSFQGPPVKVGPSAAPDGFEWRPEG